MNTSAIVKELFRVSNCKNIRYCHWKSIGHLPASFLAETDLDVLVSRHAACSFELIARELGFIECLTPGLRTYPGVKDFVCYDPSVDKFVHLHLHYQLVLGDRWVKAYRLPEEELILQRRVYSEEYQTYIVSPEDEFWMCVVRMAWKYKDAFSRTRVLKELSGIRQRLHSDSENLIKSYTKQYPFSLQSLIEAVFNEDFSTASKLLPKVRLQGREFLRYSWPLFKVLSIIRLGYRLWIEFFRRKLGVFQFGRRRLNNGGFAVAFVGIDGSGKTSLIARNKLFFSKQFDVKTVFMGGGRSGASLWRKPIFWVHDVIFKKRTNLSSLSKEIRQKESIGIARVMFHMLLSIDRSLRLMSVHRARSNGALVLIDRWPQSSVDFFVDGPKLTNCKEVSGKFTKMAYNAEKSSFERAFRLKPDLIIKLSVSPQTSFRRKPEEIDLKTAEVLCNKLEQVSFEGIKVFKIDAEQEVEEIDRLVRKIIFSGLQ